jgi:uncharacterized protein with HEPN domain
LIDDRLPVFLSEMKLACEDAIAFRNTVSRDEYLRSNLLQNATAMCLIRLGEAAIRVVEHYPAFVAAHPTWPWQQMRAMRNRGAHGYDTIVFEVVWTTLTDFVPMVLAEIEALGPLDPRT